MAKRIEISLRAKPRGIHLVTNEVVSAMREKGLKLPDAGLCNIFVKHTSCGLAICENWDPDVRHDMALDLDRIVPENAPYYHHVLEGSDDMPAHTKSALTGTSLTIPIAHGKLDLGTWQGIYLCEFRNHGGSRKLAITIIE